MKKYEKSSLTAEIQTLTLGKLQEIMHVERPFLDPGFFIAGIGQTPRRVPRIICRRS